MPNLDTSPLISEKSRALKGVIIVPGDKSISHRALMLGSIANGQTHIRGFLAGEDCLATLAALRQMGVNIEQKASDEVLIDGVGLRGLSAPETQLRYASPDLLWAVALGIIYWQGRMWIITSRGLMHEDPIVYVTKDRISYLVLLSLIVLTVIAYFYTVPIF